MSVLSCIFILILIVILQHSFIFRNLRIGRS